METPVMTFNSILKRMETPWALTPPECVQSYLYLVSLYGQKTIEYVECAQKVAQEESRLTLTGQTSAKAKALATSSDSGMALLRVKAELKVYEEMIRALKRAQAYYAEEARGNH